MPAAGNAAQPSALLSGIPGLDLREIAESGVCCGSAGIYELWASAPAFTPGVKAHAGVP
ncbi:hypothetical protein ACWCSH_36990 [Streptosporangium sp. NPDC001682]